MNLSTITTIPKVGPASYGVRGLDGIVIAAATTIGPVDFRFPRAVFVTGFLVLSDGTNTGDPVADAAHLEIKIVDESMNDIISDGQGGSNFAPALALHGMGFRPFDLQRPVVDGDHWFISLKSTYAGAETITPTVRLFFEEPFLKGGRR